MEVLNHPLYLYNFLSMQQDSIKKITAEIGNIKDELNILSASSWNGKIFFSSPLFTESHILNV